MLLYMRTWHMKCHVVRVLFLFKFYVIPQSIHRVILREIHTLVFRRKNLNFFLPFTLYGKAIGKIQLSIPIFSIAFPYRAKLTVFHIWALLDLNCHLLFTSGNYKSAQNLYRHCVIQNGINFYSDEKS